MANLRKYKEGKMSGLYLDKESKEELVEWCENNSISLSEKINELIKQFLNSQKQIS